MKYIFDFDDVLFYNTARLKPRIFEFLARAGVPERAAKDYYLQVRDKQFLLRDFIRELFARHGITGVDQDSLYEEIMSACPEFRNEKLLSRIKLLPKKDLFIITNGGREYNSDKIKYSGVGELFDPENIIIVPGTKRESIRAICERYPQEKIIFVDDRPHFIDDIDHTHCPNLKTILYTGQDANTLIAG